MVREPRKNAAGPAGGRLPARAPPFGGIQQGVSTNPPRTHQHFFLILLGRVLVLLFFFLFSVFPSAQQIWRLLGRHQSQRDGVEGWRDPRNAAPGTRDRRTRDQCKSTHTISSPCLSFPALTEILGATQALQGNETIQVALPALPAVSPRVPPTPTRTLISPSPTACFSPCSLAVPKLHPKPLSVPSSAPAEVPHVSQEEFLPRADPVSTRHTAVLHWGGSLGAD